MTLESVLEQVRKLSDSEKLALIESTAHMLQESRSAGNAAAESAVASATDIKERLIEQGQRKMAAIIQELKSRPNPTPEQMLPRGLWKGMTFNEEDFKAAEWHPSDEELDNAGLSPHR